MHFSELPLVRQNTLFEAGSEPVFHAPRLCASSPQPCRGVAVPVLGLAEGELISQRFQTSFPFSLLCEHQRVTENGLGWEGAVRSGSCEASGSPGMPGEGLLGSCWSREAAQECLAGPLSKFLKASTKRRMSNFKGMLLPTSTTEAIQVKPPQTFHNCKLECKNKTKSCPGGSACSQGCSAFQGSSFHISDSTLPLLWMGLTGCSPSQEEALEASRMLRTAASPFP